MKTWKIKLGMEDRIALRTLLSECKGSYIEGVLADKMSEDVISQQERTDFNIRTEGNMIVWNTIGKDKKPLPLEKEIAIGPEARDLICRNLLMLDEAKALERMHRHLYEVFILKPWPDPTE